ncbi:MAG: hypothetical protein IT178_16510 [Acidobacteria bacterium]|nr:hypothetical protein [Acidobacteriota bacterium]
MEVIDAPAKQSGPQRSREPALAGPTAIAHAALEIWGRHVKGLGVQLDLPAMTWLASVIKYGAHGAAQRSGSHGVEWPEVVDVVEAAMKLLPDRQCVVLRREYLHWQPLEVSARLCGMTGNAYSVSLHRARWAVGMYVAASAVALQNN